MMRQLGRMLPSTEPRRFCGSRTSRDFPADRALGSFGSSCAQSRSQRSLINRALAAQSFIRHVAGLVSNLVDRPATLPGNASSVRDVVERISV
jgi:hypothetical protein